MTQQRQQLSMVAVAAQGAAQSRRLQSRSKRCESLPQVAEACVLILSSHVDQLQAARFQAAATVCAARIARLTLETRAARVRPQLLYEQTGTFLRAAAAVSGLRDSQF